ncbi:MAG: endonuclease domain-containing protein [Candidatus Paracaedibacteraceae bacterium]|nr:endonuclease domain-containing protein [Candidatus Paracaedibacteraceae bacterium]
MNQKLSRFKKDLRKNQTDAEQILWKHLRGRRFLGWKIRRQHTLQGYIVDFVCLEHKIIIELDGGHHVERKDYDEMRTRILEQDGYKVIRFWNNEVLHRLEDVLLSILNTPHPPAGRPLPQRERWKLLLQTRSSPTNLPNINTPHPPAGRPLPQGERWKLLLQTRSNPTNLPSIDTPPPPAGRPLPQGERWKLLLQTGSSPTNLPNINTPHPPVRQQNRIIP